MGWSALPDNKYDQFMKKKKLHYYKYKTIRDSDGLSDKVIRIPISREEWLLKQRIKERDFDIHLKWNPKLRAPGPRQREIIFWRDNCTCQKCGCSKVKCLQIHHIKPWYLGGPTIPANLITLCGVCNLMAPDGIEEFLEWIKIKEDPLLVYLKKKFSKQIVYLEKMFSSQNKRLF